MILLIFISINMMSLGFGFCSNADAGQKSIFEFKGVIKLVIKYDELISDNNFLLREHAASG